MIFFDPHWNTIIRLAFIIPIVVSAFGGAIIMMFSGQYQHQLFEYKRNIQTYRSRKFVDNAINYLRTGEIQLAIDEYRKCKWFPDKYLDDYVYGMIITACFLSDDAKLHQIGVERIDKLQETFDYQKVIL